jgi:hypothetical protein
MNKDTPMSEGFIKLPRALLQNPSWKEMPLTYRHVFLTILENSCYKPTTVDAHGNLIHLQPGQFMVTIRRLVDLCDEPDIERGLVERALKRFEKVGFSRQETRHKKTIITITEPSFCEELKIGSETRFTTKSRQNHDIKEERKERKERNTPSYSLTGEAASSAAGGFSSSYFQMIQKDKECTYVDAQGVTRFKNIEAPPILTSDNISYGYPTPLLQAYKKKLNSKVFAENSQPMILSRHFFSLIKNRKKDFKEPNLQKWAATIDLMLRIDERKPEDIKQVMEWAILDDFWCTVVMCAAKLRKHFDTLQLKSQRVVKPAAFQAKDGMVESNRQLAQAIDRKFQGTFKSWKIEVYQDSIAFYMGAAATTFKFTEHGFQDQVLNAMRKWGMPIDGLNATFRTEIGLESRKAVG